MWTKHGHARVGKETPEYRAYFNMIARCYNESHDNYAEYGGRGITVCKRWLAPDGVGILNFLRDMGKRPHGHSLERKRNHLGYSPRNCVWAPKKTQMRNRRNTVMLTYKGKTKPMPTWADELGIPLKTLRSRVLQYGWSIVRAFETPIRTRS